MKKVILVGLSLLIGLTSVFAQGRKGFKGYKKNPELRAALKTHYQKEMLPVLQAKHDAFDKKLSSTDLAFLTAKRAESKQLHVAQRALHQKIKAAHQEGKTREEVKELFSKERQQMRANRKALMDAMQPFIERNQVLITQTQEELESNRAQWRVERKAIHEKYRPADAPTMEEYKKKHGEKAARNPERAEKYKAMHQQRKTLRFLLWDGATKSSAELETGDQNSGIKGLEEAETITLSNYPNPAKTYTNIQFELPNLAQEVTLTITTLEGKTVQQQNLGKRAEGQHKIQVDVSNLSNGQYFYTLEVDEKKLSKTFMVSQ